MQQFIIPLFRLVFLSAFLFVCSALPTQAQAQTPSTLVLNTPFLQPEVIRISSAENKVQLMFTATAKNGQATITKIVVNLKDSDVRATSFQLLNRDILAASVPAVDGKTATLELEESLENNPPSLYILEAVFDQKSGIRHGSKCTFEISSLEYINSDGKHVTLTRPITSTPHFYNAIADIIMYDKPAISAGYRVSGEPAVLVGNFSLMLFAKGASVKKLSGSDIRAEFVDTLNSLTYPAATVSATTIPNQDIPDGSFADAIVIATLPGSQLKRNGLYQVRLTGIRWIAGTDVVNQDWGLESFHSNLLPIVTVEPPQILEMQQKENLLEIIVKSRGGFTTFEQSADLINWTDSVELPGSGIHISDPRTGEIVYRGIFPVMSDTQQLFYRAVITP